MEEMEETFEPGDPADPSQPGYNQPPGQYVDAAKEELGENASWSDVHRRAFEMKAAEEAEDE